jgi:FkbM family methyltransferase
MTEFFSFRYGPDTIQVPYLPHHLPREIRRLNTFYELDLLEHLRDAVPRGGVWVDVGANIGNHTVYFSRYLADSVVALEPHPGTATVLTDTVRANGLTNVTIHRCGASETTGTARLGIPDPDNPGTGMIAPDGPLTIQLSRLDDLLATSGPIRLIKVDVQGHELPALRGALAVLKRNRPHLAVEAMTEPELRDLEAFATPLGYQVIAKCGASATYHLAPWTRFDMLRFRAKRKWRHLTRKQQ